MEVCGSFNEKLYCSNASFTSWHEKLYGNSSSWQEKLYENSSSWHDKFQYGSFRNSEVQDTMRGMWVLLGEYKKHEFIDRRKVCLCFHHMIEKLSFNIFGRLAERAFLVFPTTHFSGLRTIQ